MLKFGEIVLKGLNRGNFETILIKNIKRRLAGMGEIELWKAQSTVYVRFLDEFAEIAEAEQRLSTVFGIAALCRAGVTQKDIAQIKQDCVVYFEEKLSVSRTFKVEAKRSDKTFPLISPQICAEVGERILESYPHLRVDVNNPDVVITVEVRETAAYLHANRKPGAGGIPVGASGRAALLISGGIDSPVAGYMMSKRGLTLTAIHFVSPPYTGQRALLKVEALLQKIAAYCGRINFIVVPFTEIQETIRRECPEDLFTILMRRLMMRISERIAIEHDCGALVTGESLGQVASQTIAAIACTDSVCTMPVFRPLIGMDKEEIVKISRKIDTFETSILPYEDCCTVFTPRHPRTRPQLESVERAEQRAKTDWKELIDRAVAGVEYKTIDA